MLTAAPGTAPAPAAEAPELDEDDPLFAAVGARPVKRQAPSPLSPEDDDDGD